jgi:NAD(P)-dependent dehydrogenase (short-subunit alcohol dehydrogenase family)
VSAVNGSELAGRTVFVAGATGTVGRAVSQAAARAGANLILHGRTASAAIAGLSAKVRAEHGVQVRVVAGDVTEGADLDRIRDELAAADLTVLHALVNCTTGFDGRPVGAADLSAKDFRHVVDVDVAGSFLLVQALLPLLAAAGGARVILFSSQAGIRGRPGAPHLCAAKAGVTGLALALARDLAPQKVIVHALAPGPIGHHSGPVGMPAITPEKVADAAIHLATQAGDPFEGAPLLIAGDKLGQPGL